MKQFILISLIIFYSLSLAAQSLDKIKLENQIDSIFKPLDNGHAPGVAVTVLQNGQVIAKKNYGLANLEHQIPFTQESPVRLGYSGGREFMCVGLALMEAEGLLHFDDKINTYFPKLPEWSKEVTIQDLLNHSSGFDDEWATLLLMHADMNNRLDKEQFLTFLYNQPKPQVEPGKGYMYCNSDFALLRFIMEIASKQSLPKYLKKHLFDPLEMSSTFMNDNLYQLIPGFAESYDGANGNFFKRAGVKTSPGGNYRFVTTAADLERWALALEDTASLPSKAFTQLYKNARVIPMISPAKHYVFGHEWHSIDTTTLIKHGGVNEDFYMFRIPSRRISVIGLGNSWNNMSMAMQLADSLLPGTSVLKASAPKFSAEPVVLDKKELATYVGRYFEKKNSYSSYQPAIQFYDIKLEGDNLNFYYTSNGSFPITPFGDGLFKDMDYDTPIQFTLSHPDSTLTIKVWAPDGRVLNFQQEKDKVSVTGSYLQQFTGQFHSPHLDYYCRILLNENGQLIIRRPTLSDKILEPNGENHFLFEMDHQTDSWYVEAEFTKNETGKVDGINMQHVRMMHHRFEKVE